MRRMFSHFARQHHFATFMVAIRSRELRLGSGYTSAPVEWTRQNLGSTDWMADDCCCDSPGPLRRSNLRTTTLLINATWNCRCWMQGLAVPPGRSLLPLQKYLRWPDS